MIVEREQQLSFLEQRVERAHVGRGSLILLSGEAGIGKSSLVDAFSQRIESLGCIWGLCDPLFTPQPLGPVYEIAAALNQETKELVEQSATSAQLFPAILSALKSKPGVTVLIIEDLHWADYATLDFIKYIGRRVSILNIVLIVSFRDDEINNDHPLNAVLGDLPSRPTFRLKLEPLSLSGIEKLNRDQNYSPEELLKITGGNPFFLTELLATKKTNQISIPTSVQDAITARLSRLVEAERNFLEFISAIPGHVRIKFHCRDYPNADTLAMACVARGILILEANGTIRFRHEIARLATQSSVRVNRLRETHQTLLEILIANSPTTPLDQIVHHAAGAYDGKAVIKFAPRAAANASKLGAHREAAAHLSTALRFIDEAEPETAALLYETWATEAGLALVIDDELIEARRHAVSLWRALNRPEKVGENLRWLSRLHWYRGEAAEAARYLDEATKILETTDSTLETAMAFSMRSQMHLLNSNMDLAIEWGEKALTLVDNESDDKLAIEVRAHALNNIGTSKIFRGDRSGIKHMEESLELAKQYSMDEQAARVYTNLAEYAVEFHEFDLAEQVLSEGIAFDTQHDLDSWTYYLVGRLAQLRLEQCRFSEAIAIAEGALKRREQTVLMRMPSKIVLAKATLRLGLEGANTMLSECLSSALKIDETQYIIPIRIAMIESAWYQGAHESALEHIAALNKINVSRFSEWLYAEFLVWAQLFDHCSLPNKLDQTPTTMLPIPFAHFFDKNFSTASKAFKQHQADYFAGLSLGLSGDLVELNSSLRALHKIGATPLSKTLISIALKSGFERNEINIPRGKYKAAKRHPLGLTPKEQNVLSMIVKGASNKEIAQTTSRSIRTIEHHVSSVLAKLNVENRMEALLRVQNEPWLLNLK